MDEQNSGFDQPAAPVGPEIDDTGNPTEAAPTGNGQSTESAPNGEKPRAPAGREMLIQLQQMIDNVSYQAAPVVREVAAKAAELAAVAGQKAGPLAYKAAGVTEQFGQRVAERSRTVAADLRRRDEGQPPAGDAGSAEPSFGELSEPGEPGTPDQGPGESTEQF
jgi:hypothetical protein